MLVDEWLENFTFDFDKSDALAHASGLPSEQP